MTPCILLFRPIDVPSYSSIERIREGVLEYTEEVFIFHRRVQVSYDLFDQVGLECSAVYRWSLEGKLHGPFAVG